MTLAEIRAGLHAARKQQKRSGLTLDRLQENSGVDRAVIHRIESVRKYPRYKPGIDTVLRLVEGMGLTLSSFFAEIEGGPKVGLQPAIPQSQNSPVPQHLEADHGRDLPAGVVLTNEQYEEYRRLRAREAAAAESVEQATKTRAQKSVRSRPRPKRN